MKSNYINSRRQGNRLGSIEYHGLGNFGEGAATDLIAKLKGGVGGGGGGDTATGIINALGRIGTNVLRIIEQGKTMRTHIRHKFRYLTVKTKEGTIRLEIVQKAEVEKAKIEVERVMATYSGLTKIIWGGGTVASGLLISAATGYYIVKAAQRKA